MAKFRIKSQGTKTVNKEGAEAFAESPELELVSLLLTSFVQDKFYESAEDQLDRLQMILKSLKDKKFAAKAAIYARNEFGMRSITHALIAELVKLVKGQEWTKIAVEKTMRRPDDMLETLGYYLSVHKKPIPNSLKKGLRDAVKKFDKYQLAKYKGSKSDLKLVDLFNIVHPKPTQEMDAIYKKLMKGELKSEGTWETKQTKAGQEASKIENREEREEKLKELKKENWTELIKDRKLGYFALLRNLRNILSDAPEVIEEAVEMLTDEKLVKKSLILPFRFDTAMQEIQKTSFDKSRLVVTALSQALDISLKNVPVFEGKTLVVLDESGSMSGRPIDIGALFSAILYKSNNADLMLFSDNARYKTLNPTDSTLTICSQIKKNLAMSGTNFHSIFRKADKAYDRIIILSDMQGWENDSGWGWNYSGTPQKALEDYKKKTGADPKIYSFDLEGYGSLQFPERNVFAIAGWSDKVFDVMKLLEQDRNALIKTIEEYIEL